MTGPLAGIRVIDFGQYIAGPLTAMLLADHGADVIRVDPPSGPTWKTPANATWNRGKRSIALDLKQPTDRQTAQALIAGADVVIEGFRPGVMDRLGLGESAALAADPRLIYCSLPGFASDDPRAQMPGWEGVIGAATATYRPPIDTPKGPPAYTAIQIASHFAGFQAAVAIVMALVARERSGLGQRIEMPLFDATFAAIGAHGLLINGGVAGGRPDDFWGGLFECGDGRWVFFSGSTPRFRRRFVEAAGIQSWEAEGLLDIPRMTRELELGAQLRPRLRALFKTRPALEWQELGAAAGVPITVSRTSAEWIREEHARTAGIVREVADPALGEMWQPGRAVRLSAFPDDALRPASPLDADRASVLADAARPAGTVTSTHAALTQALGGMRVVDVSLVLAGPTAGRTLAEYGAHVVKINGPREEGAGYRTSIHRYHTDVNRAKETILLDLKDEAGREVFFNLVRQADVVVQNFRLGVPERMGIGYEQLRAIKPDLIHVSVSAFGYGGPWGNRPGYEPNAQAATGLQMRFGGDDGPLMQPFAVNDYGTGLLGAFGAGLALYHRARTGQGQRVEAALAYTGTLLQSAHLNDYAGKVWNEPRGRTARGTGPLHQMYRAADGWLFLGASEDQLSALASVDGLAGCAALAGEAPNGGTQAGEAQTAGTPVGEANAVGTPSGETLAAFLDARFAEGSVEQWVSALTAAGVAASQVVTSVPAVMVDPWVVSHGLSVTRPHDTGEQVTTIGPGVRLSRTPVTPGRPAATPGADARSVLEQAGAGDQWPALNERGVVLERP